MDNNDLQLARSQLTQALAVSGPIFTALQQASAVFDVMQNATVHKAALEKDVADLQQQAEDAKTARANWDAMTAMSMQRASDAEAEAKQRIAAAEAGVRDAVAAAEDSQAKQLADARAQADAALAELAKAVADGKAEHADQVAAANGEKAALQADIDALQSKLDSLKLNAQKFADALRG